MANASAAPPIRYPNVYGIDMPSATELVAHGRSLDEIREVISCDKLIYQDLEDLIEAVNREGKTNIKQFDTSVFDGVYVTGDVNDEYLEQLELIRNDAAKEARDETARSILEIHNNP